MHCSQLVEFVFPINVLLLYLTLPIHILLQKHVRFRLICQQKTVRIDTDCFAILCKPVPIEFIFLLVIHKFSCFSIFRKTFEPFNFDYLVFIIFVDYSFNLFFSLKLNIQTYPSYNHKEDFVFTFMIIELLSLFRDPFEFLLNLLLACVFNYLQILNLDIPSVSHSIFCVFHSFLHYSWV